MKKRFWTPEELQTLKELYPDTLTQVIADKINHPIKAVYRKAYDLGLSKSEAFRKSETSGRIQKLASFGDKFRFKKGHVPFNKGLNLEDYTLPEFIMKFRRSQFPKGNKPANYREIGSVRIDKDGYAMIKVKDGLRGWRLLHQVNWEKAFGPIPKGLSVTFKDGDRKNFEPTNLVLRTRAELMICNSIQQWPEEIQTAMRSLSKLEKAISDRP